MGVDIRDGWVFGRLPGASGKTYPLKHFEQKPRDTQTGQIIPYQRLLKNPPNYLLHETQVDRYIPALKYPTQFQVGVHEGQVIIGQHRPTWARGAATDAQDAYAMQVEIQGDTVTTLHLPPPAILDALVALTAFLHTERLITTGVKRPDGQSWPLANDFAFAARDTYYRRHAGLWPDTPGVYSHVEMPWDEHWDVGGWDYPTFFARVRKVLEGDPMLDEFITGLNAAEAKAKQADGSIVDPGPPPTGKSRHFDQGWADKRWNIRNLEGRRGPRGPKGDTGDVAVLAVGTQLSVEQV